MDSKTTAYIGLGSNLEEPLANCLRALHKLDSEKIQVVRCSSFYRTQAVGYEKQPHFVNAVVQVITDLGPEELFAKMQEIEKDLGKESSFKWGPRKIDLDLLLYGNEVVDEIDLQVPHPLMHERKFVLAPLAEIAPQLEHPLFKNDIAHLLEENHDPKFCLRLRADNPCLTK